MKTIAMIAHDGKKADILQFANDNKKMLSKCNLIATKTTGKLLKEKVGLKVKCFMSGPMGGDAEIAALVANKKVDAVIFITDPLDAHPHDPDINGLLRVCNVHNIPLASNIATAQLIISRKRLF
ncbi:MAG: methylglyoxal synthase [Bacteriovoracaceae bacterium]|nr:methylglyoxal synthase [Bacteroidota bacterium]